MRRLFGIAFVLAVACSQRPVAVAVREAAAPSPTPWATITLETPSPPPPTPRPRPVVRVTPRPTAAVVDALAPFRGLGSWSDVYDYSDDPATIVPLVRDMAAHGARVLYVETARHGSRSDIAYPRALGAALDAAKAFGMRAVAWYPPDFSNVAFDLRRSFAAINFRSPEGNRFDAFGADVEQAGIKNWSEINRRVAEYSRVLRQRADVPLAAIVYPPTQLQRRPGLWPGYPWQAFGRYYDIVMAMHYWTYRTSDPALVAQSTARNAELVRELTGRPAHVIGGLAGDATPAEIAAYTIAAIESGSIGGSLYDGRTTSAAEWVQLAALNR